MENEEEVEAGSSSSRLGLEINKPKTAPGPAQLQSGANGTWKGKFMFAPSVEEVTLALEDLKKILKPLQQTGKGYKDPELDLVFRAHLEGMKQFMWTYINPISGFTGCWSASSLHTADCLQRGPLHAQSLQDWVQAFATNYENLPVNPMGHWNESVIDKDPIIAQEIHVHLQGIKKLVKVMDLVNLMDTPEMQAKSGLKKRIDILTAQRWMKNLDYCWTYDPKGQYVDGHE